MSGVPGRARDAGRDLVRRPGRGSCADPSEAHADLRQPALELLRHGARQLGSHPTIVVSCIVRGRLDEIDDKLLSAAISGTDRRLLPSF